jgi:ferredoxin
MNENTYQQLADRLNALPNGFPPTDDGAELKLLAKLYSPDEAALAAKLRLTLETPDQIADRIGGDPKELKICLKSMVKRGLISAGRAEGGLGYGLMPFAVGIYEMQVNIIDEELAQLFENYYQQAFGEALRVKPALHRVIPVNETVQMDMEVQPFESVSDIIGKANAWGVIDCICRKQKGLIGDPCNHPLEVCMVMNKRPGAFDNNPHIRGLTLDEAYSTLQFAAESGLVHSVSNDQRGSWYICNCCTCSCAVLRGMADLGIANVIARSAFVNYVDEELCLSCGDCIEYCQFDALTLDEFAQVDSMRCVGCGVCVPVCPENALSLIRRPEEEIKTPPADFDTWMRERAQARNLDINEVL